MKVAILVLALCAAVCSGWNYLQDLKMWDPSICCYPIPPGCCPACLECIDIAFIMDDSGSISPAQHGAIKSFLLDLINDARLPKHPDLQTAMVKFSRAATLLWNWGAVTEEADYIAAVNLMTQMGRFTEPVPGMEMVEDLVIGSPGDRPECPNACVIITDGLAQDTVANLQAAADSLRAACGSFFVVGVTISVPAVGMADFDEQLMAMAGGNPEYKFTTEDFTGLPDLFSDIIDMWCEEFGSGSSKGECCPFDYIFMVSKKPTMYW